jgi:hypothetical protein
LRVQIVRFVNFVALALIAVVLHCRASASLKNSFLALVAVLFLFATPPFEALMGYSLQLISSSLPSIYLSMLAFCIHFREPSPGTAPNRMRPALVFLLLILAMQSTQTYALFALIPASLLALFDWQGSKSRLIPFIGICALAMGSSIALYGVGVKYFHSLGGLGYRPGEESLGALLTHPGRLLLRSINPFTYWSAFAFWSYPFPFSHVPPLKDTKHLLALVAECAWGILLLAAIWVELRRTPADQKGTVVEKWFFVLASIGFGALFIMADSPV